MANTIAVIRGYQPLLTKSVEPPPSALNMTLPACAAELRRLQHDARIALTAIDRYILPARRSAANPPTAVAAVDR